MALVQRLEAQLRAAQVAQVLDVVGHHLLVEAGHLVADGVVAPAYLLLATLLDHGAVLLHQLGREQLRLFLFQFQQDVAEQPQVRVLVAVDVADLLHRPRHEVVAPQVVEEHEAAVEVHALQDVVRHQHARERLRALVVLKLVVQVADELVARQQMLVLLPLVQHVVALLRFADGVQHVAVALAVHRLLEGLDGQAQVHLVGRDVLAHGRQVRRLQAVKKDEERQDLVVGAPLRRGQLAVVLYVHPEVDLLGYPEVVHSLAIPVAHPLVLHIVEVVQVRRIPPDHPPIQHIGVAKGVEQRLLLQLAHKTLPSRKSATDEQWRKGRAKRRPSG